MRNLAGPSGKITVTTDYRAGISVTASVRHVIRDMPDVSPYHVMLFELFVRCYVQSLEQLGVRLKVIFRRRHVVLSLGACYLERRLQMQNNIIALDGVSISSPCS